jgi:hypothetical protein
MRGLADHLKSSITFWNFQNLENSFVAALPELMIALRSLTSLWTHESVHKSTIRVGPRLLKLLYQHAVIFIIVKPILEPHQRDRSTYRKKNG